MCCFSGIISYTEYLFLLCILTSEYMFSLYCFCHSNHHETLRYKQHAFTCSSAFCSYQVSTFVIPHFLEPHAGFRIAFNMFDADGNEMVDKREFMVVCFFLFLLLFYISVYTYMVNPLYTTFLV